MIILLSPMRVDHFYECQSNAMARRREKSLRRSRVSVESVASVVLDIRPSGWLRRRADDSVDLERGRKPCRLSFARSLIVSYDHGAENGL